MWRPWLVSRLPRWLRSLAGSVQRLSTRAARRASASALQRFTLAQCAAALALVALTFALLVARKLSTASGNPPMESRRAAQFDAGTARGQDVNDEARRDPAQLPAPASK